MSSLSIDKVNLLHAAREEVESEYEFNTILRRAMPSSEPGVQDSTAMQATVTPDKT